MTARLADRPVHWGEWPAWLDQARADGITPACDGATRLFFPAHGKGSQAAIREAKAICHTCPLLDTCREWALEQHPVWLYGVWGGLTKAERKARHPRGPQPANLRKHSCS